MIYDIYIYINDIYIFDIWYMIYDIWYIYIWYMIYDIWYMIYDIWYMIYIYDIWYIYMIYDKWYIYIYIPDIWYMIYIYIYIGCISYSMIRSHIFQTSERRRSIPHIDSKDSQFLLFFRLPVERTGRLESLDTQIGYGAFGVLWRCLNYVRVLVPLSKVPSDAGNIMEYNVYIYIYMSIYIYIYITLYFAHMCMRMHCL